MKSSNIDEILSALDKSWSLDSSTLWKASNPALGQCGVTALVVQDYIGGEIYKTRVQKPGRAPLWHFYNAIDGLVIDFTASQFDEPINYDNVPSNREEAFADTNRAQYTALKTGFETHFRPHFKP